MTSLIALRLQPRPRVERAGYVGIWGQFLKLEFLFPSINSQCAISEFKN